MYVTLRIAPLGKIVYDDESERLVRTLDTMDFILGNQPYFEDFITRSTYHSNAIEGSTLSYAQTYAIIFNDNSMTVSATPREIYEAINHKYALDYVFHHIDEPLSERMIKEIAQCINKNINEFSGYRTGQVFIRGAEHIPPPPAMVPTQMMYFVHNYNNTEYSSLFEKIAANHIALERIHPFSDGNGRTGRLLLNFELIRNNVAPVVIPKEVRADYMALIAGQQTAELAGFLQEFSQVEQQRMDVFLQAEQAPQPHMEL